MSQIQVYPKYQKTEANQYITQEVQDKDKQQQCPAQNDTVLHTRKYHKVKRENMRPQKSKNCAIRHRTEHKEDQNVMLPHKPPTKVKKPDQETYKEVLQNKNSSNVNIVNMKPQKPSWNYEWSRKPAAGTKSSLCRDRNCQSTRCFKKATKCYIQRVQRNQDVEMTRTVNHPSL